MPSACLAQREGWITSGWYDGNEEGPRPIILQTRDGGARWQRLSYRAHAAPWVWYGALPALLVAFYGFAASYREMPAAAPATGIEDIGWSDRPIGWDDPDVLDLKPLARALARFVRNRDTEPPLTVAVTGPWGSGKSSLMNLVADDLRRAGTRTVSFNAWHHQKEEHLLAALLANIRDQAIPPAWRLSGLIFRVRLLRLRLGKQFLGLTVAFVLLAVFWLVFSNLLTSATGPLNAGQTWLSGLLEPPKPKGFLERLVEVASGAAEPKKSDATTRLFETVFGVGAVSALLAIIAKILVQVLAFTNPAKLMASVSQKARVSQFSEQLSFRHRFAAEFGEVCRALRYGHHAGVVVMIDDLDRCRSGNVMEVLEAINFLSSAGACFVFIGMAKDKVVAAIDAEIKLGRSEAERYLEKLVNIEVLVPKATPERSKALSLPPSRSRGAAWPDRVRSALRAAPDMLVPAALAFALVAAAITIMPRSGDTGGTAAGTTDTRAPDAATPPGAGGGAGGTRTGPIGGVRDGAVAGPRPVAPEQLEGRPPWPAYALLAFLLVAMVLAALRRSTNASPRVVADSPAFRQALEIWHPVIFAANPMPRGVKRHQNRLRFQAMRLRPLKRERDWLDRLFRADAATDEDAPPLPLTDSKLVAASALCAVLALPELGSDDSPVKEEIDRALAAHLETFPQDQLDEAEIKSLREVLMPSHT